MKLSGYDVGMAVVHIPEAEAARDFAGLLGRVRSGEQVLIDSGDRSYTLVPAPPSGWFEQPRLLSDVLASIRQHAADSLLDDEFANDVEDGIRSHEGERLIDPWESF